MLHKWYQQWDTNMYAEIRHLFLSEINGIYVEDFIPDG